tara:strand:+ start:917 stop:1333 length:417 start_codon:yes stop_codon:yes gene_type:complete
MASGTIEDIGSGIKTRLETITGLLVFAPNELPESVPDTPCAMIMPPGVEYNSTFGGASEMTFRLLLLVAKGDQPEALNKLMDYLDVSGALSIKTAIEGDNTLNSQADSSQVLSASGAGVIMWGGYPYLGTEFTLIAYK